MARSTRYVAGVQCFVLRLRDGRVLEERLADFSRSGLRIASAAPLVIGERVRVAFRDPLWKLPLEVWGAVARRSYGRRRGDGGPSFAVAIDSVSGWADYLLVETSRVRAPVPRARQPRTLE